MRAGLALLLLAAPVPGQGGSTPPDAAGAANAFVEMVVDREAWFVQEAIPLRVRFGFDERFLSENVIQPFRQRLDVPARLELEWLRELPGAVVLPPAGTATGPQRTTVVNGGQAVAEAVEGEVREGRRFTVLQIERRILATSAGELVLPSPVLRFDYATRFEDDFLEGRVPVDRKEGVVQGRPLTLRIRPLPALGQPPEFTGAVGSFRVTADARPRVLAAGEVLQLVLRVEGEGNLSAFEAPALDGLRGFHVYGRIEELGPTHRAFTYDLVPLRPSTDEVPSIAFAYFDPAPTPRYRTVHTDPIPLQVGPPAPGVVLPERPEEPAPAAIAGEDDIFGLLPDALSQRAGPRALSPLAIAAGGLLPWLLFLLARCWRSARARAPDRAELAARGAADRFRHAAGAGGAQLAPLLAEFLATHLGCAAAAVIAPDLERRLRTAGIEPRLARRTADLLDRLAAARFGGATTADAEARAVELVEELQRSFRGEGSA